MYKQRNWWSSTDVCTIQIQILEINLFVYLSYDLTRMPTVESLRDLIKHTRVRITKTEDCTVIPMIIVGRLSLAVRLFLSFLTYACHRKQSRSMWLRRTIRTNLCCGWHNRKRYLIASLVPLRLNALMIHTCTEFGLPHTTTSALVNYNVEETFLNLAHTVLGYSILDRSHHITKNTLMPLL